jgi:hypothetical protein
MPPSTHPTSVDSSLVRSRFFAQDTVVSPSAGLLQGLSIPLPHPTSERPPRVQVVLPWLGGRERRATVLYCNGFFIKPSQLEIRIQP